MTAAPDIPLLARLEETVGVEYVDRAPSLDAAGVRPAVAVRPGTREEVAAVLRVAREAGAAVVPWGGGMEQRIGAPPARADVLLHTTRLNRILEWEPADLTACIEAGATLGAVQAALAERGQQIAVDAPVAERATLGGLVSTATAGPRRWQFGGWRDLVVGMHIALPDGTVIKTGGRVVKNVQGYDLSKLYTGALGTLGVIVQVNLKLVPLPAVRRLHVARGELAAVTAWLDAVASSSLRVSTLDLLDDAAARRCGLAGDGAAGLVLSEGPAAVVEAQSVSLSRFAREAGVAGDVIEGEALDGLWSNWVNLDRLDDLPLNEAVITVTAPPAETGAVVAELRHAAARCGVRAHCWARAGNGIVRARLAADDSANLVAVHETMLESRPGATLVCGDPALARRARSWGSAPEGLGVMRALKARFDPAGIMQPGRFAGGI
jgi:glycolate oxidase FAD binding subunit